jgi:hypothetical protein
VDRLEWPETPILSNAVAVVSGYAHSCALLGTGTVRCWGENASGQLGDGTTTDRRAPTVVSGLDNVVGLAAGDNHTCALRYNGRVYCWGENEGDSSAMARRRIAGHRSGSQSSRSSRRSLRAALIRARSSPARSSAGARTASASSATARRRTSAHR